MPQNKTPLSKPPFTTIRQIGIGGLVLKGDPQDIKDVESPDLRNISFDSGVVGPRNGTTLFVAAPAGETGTPTQLLKAKDSNGTSYLIGVYGTNFYLLDPKNKAWIKLNGTYSPTQSGLFYGSACWNYGTGSDAFYFGNGIDYVMKWVPLLTYLSAAAGSGDSQITVADASLIPSSGVLAIGTQQVTVTYNQTGASLSFSVQPTAAQTVTLNINGTTITVQFVSSVSAPGDILIGPDLAGTITNLLGLLQNPSVTNSTQVALSGPNQLLLSKFTITAPLISDQISTVQLVPNASVQYLIVAGTSAPTVAISNPNNIIAISGTVGSNLANGTGITVPITAATGIPKGNKLVIGTASGAGFRLFVSGVQKYENYIYWSNAFNWVSPSATVQENFTSAAGTFTGSGMPGSGGQPVPYGEGGIIDLIDFGSYLAALKNNSLVNIAFTIDTTDDTTDLVPSPLIFGESVFPVGQNVNIVIENALYLTTISQGIYELVPASTGNTLSTTFQPFSDSILSLFSSGLVNFSKGRSAFFNRAWYIPCSTIPNVNDIVLVFDFVWGVWTIWDNLNAADMQESNGTLYILCGDDGGLYYIDPNSYQDFRSGVPIGYSTYLFTKRFDWDKPANVKQQSLAMIQGYIGQTTKLYVDVLFNENGSLAAATYEIDGNNSIYVEQIPIYGPGRISLGQNPIGGAQEGTIGVFRVYLDLAFGVGAHVVQFKVRSQNIGDNWGITGVSVNPELNEVIPTDHVIGII